MINVCAHYNGSVILLAEFENEEEAEIFMSHDCWLSGYGDEAEIVYTDEMFICDEIPVSEPVTEIENTYDLPF